VQFSGESPRVPSTGSRQLKPPRTATELAYLGRLDNHLSLNNG
jgi:hypothetical protein